MTGYFLERSYVPTVNPGKSPAYCCGEYSLNPGEGSSTNGEGLQMKGSSTIGWRVSINALRCNN